MARRAGRHAAARPLQAEVTLRPGMAVEIPIEELCAPECDVDLIAGWLVQPPGLLRPIVAGVEAVRSEPVDDRGYDFEFVPVPSIESESVSQSVELKAEDEQTLLLTITSPSPHDAPQPVAYLAVDAEATGLTGESYLEGLEIGVGEKEFWLDADSDQTEDPFETPVPLTCTANECTVEVPIRLLSTAKQPLSVDLAFRVDVFHPEFDSGIVQLKLS